MATASDRPTIIARRRRLFVPLWHPPEGGAAGGFLRAKRLLESLKSYELLVVDTDTTDIALPPKSGSLIRIPARRIRSQRFHTAARTVNWLWVSANIFVAGMRAGTLDAVYVPTGDILATSLPALLVAMLRRIPVVAVTFDGPGEILWPLNRLVHRRFRAVITLSRASQERLQRDGLMTPIFLGLIGVDRPPQLVPDEPASIEWDAVYIARHVPSKGVFDVLEIWRRVVARSPGRRLAMAGAVTPAIRAEIERRIAAYGLADSIALLGIVDVAMKWRLYRGSRVCLFPSRSEGWGLVPVEAHACGIPVVAYDLPAYAENIAQSAGATLCAVGDRDAAATAVLRYFDGERPDPHALQAFAKRFGWEAAVAREEAILASVLRFPEQPPGSS